MSRTAGKVESASKERECCLTEQYTTAHGVISGCREGQTCLSRQWSTTESDGESALSGGESDDHGCEDVAITFGHDIRHNQSH
jgi:hypothetical protein